MGFNTKQYESEEDLGLAPGFPAIRREGTILTGQTLERYSVLGKITVGGKLQLLDKDATDGSEDFFCVLADYVDASAADKVAPIFRTGEFVADKLILASGTVVADVQAAMEALQCWPQAAVELAP